LLAAELSKKTSKRGKKLKPGIPGGRCGGKKYTNRKFMAIVGDERGRRVMGNEDAIAEKETRGNLSKLTTIGKECFPKCLKRKTNWGGGTDILSMGKEL